LHYLANRTLPNLAVELIIFELKEGFCRAYIEKGARAFVGEK